MKIAKIAARNMKSKRRIDLVGCFVVRKWKFKREIRRSRMNEGSRGQQKKK